MSRLIGLEDIVHDFGEQRVLDGLTFEVRPGEIYALLGRNGSGKTTALRVLLGFLAPRGGRSEVLGQDSLALSAATRGAIGYLGEGQRLYRHMRVSDLLVFEAGTREPFDRLFADDAIRRLELRADQRVSRLSRGQRAQLALVLALAGDPRVLIMDDPAMGLDTAMRREFLDAMIELLGRRGVAVLFSSHVLPDVERIADRVGILHGGRLVVDAPLDELRQRVRRGHLSRTDGSAISEPPEVSGLVTWRPCEGGAEVTLVDVQPDLAGELETRGLRLSSLAAPGLEELFLDVTGGRGPAVMLPEDM